MKRKELTKIFILFQIEKKHWSPLFILKYVSFVGVKALQITDIN